MSPPNRLCFLLTSKNSSQVHIILKWRYVHRSYKLNINWPAHNIWVFIAQLVEHCSANAEAMGSNPVEALQLFFSAEFAIVKIAIITAMVVCSFHSYFRSSYYLHSVTYYLDAKLKVFTILLLESISRHHPLSEYRSVPDEIIPFFSRFTENIGK